jgi:geranylgeranyl diphosphate synthase type I
MVASTENILNRYLAAIEIELQQALLPSVNNENHLLHDMLTYHLGWQDKNDNNKTSGKRIRPLLTLLTCSTAGGDWQRALPAAAAVELVHNFSLIHDDIEDNSALRRGRPTVWKKWGIPQAINAGDAMFTLAHLHSIQLAHLISPSVAVKAVEILQNACLQLTQGQYLDLEFEQRDNVTIDDYWSMVEGKTAALISASTELGALSSECDENVRYAYKKFGRLLGLAFQVQDDFLGIWGIPSITGKSAQSDLLTRKKTLPVIFGLSKHGLFAKRWRQPVHSEDTEDLTYILDREGGKDFTHAMGNELINQALLELERAQPRENTASILKEMAISLSTRQM